MVSFPVHFQNATYSKPATETNPAIQLSHLR